MILIGVIGFGFIPALTPIFWSGGYSAAVFTLSFVDEQGNPVDGVKLTALNHLGEEDDDFYKKMGLFQDQEIWSDSNGVMKIQFPYGWKMGGKRWNYMWIIPVETGGIPERTLVFTSSEFQTKRLSLRDLYHTSQRVDEFGVVMVLGEEEELDSYVLRVVLSGE